MGNSGEKFYHRYLAANRDQPASWDNFRHSLAKGAPHLLSITPIASLTPFAGHPRFQSFTEEQKQRLFRNFVIFMSEAVAFLEQLFIVSARSHLKEKTGSSSTRACPTENTLTEAAKKMVREEFNHLRHFKFFLKSVPSLHWPRDSFFLRRKHALRRFLMGVVRWEPLCVLLPAAKLEIFSLVYSKILIQEAPAEEAWTELNRLHVLDEVHHIPLDYEWAEIEVGQYLLLRKIKWTLATLLFILGMQVVILSAWSEVMSRGLKLNNLFSRTLWGFRGIKWGVCDFVASLETKQKVRSHFSKRGIPSKFILSFMQW